MLGLFMYKRRENEFMKKRMIRFCCGVMAAGLLLSGIPVPAMSGNMQKVAVSVLAEDAVIVTDYDEFANALSSGKKNIVVEGSFTIRDDKLTETDGSIKGQMKPVQIPGGQPLQEMERGVSPVVIQFRSWGMM